MNKTAKALCIYVIVFHILIFTVEAFFWMRPSVHEFALAKLNPGLNLALHEQALTLRSLFINQGFYNLFLALGGILGFALMAKGKPTPGLALLCYMCFSAVGAGIVLFVTTHAYAGAFFQAVPSAIALIIILRNYSRAG